MYYQQREWHNMSSKSRMSKQMGKAKQGRKRRRRGADWLAHSHLESWSWGVSLATKSHPAPLSAVPSFAFVLILLPSPKALPPNTASPRAGSMGWAPGTRIWQRPDEVVLSVHLFPRARSNLPMLFDLRQS